MESSVVEVSEVLGVGVGYGHFVGAVLRDDACRAAPSAVEDVKRVIVVLQPVTLMLMAAMAYGDGKSRQAEALVEAAKIQQEPASAQ